MKIKRAYKFRLYPNKEQREAFTKHFGCCRFVYNYFLRRRIDYYMMNRNGDGKKGLNYYDTSQMLTNLKYEPDYIWLNEINSQALQQSLRDLDTAYVNFFKRRANFPRFKSRRGKQSFRVPQQFWIEDGKLRLPKIPSLVSMTIHRPVVGRMKHVVISQTKTNKYFASIFCEVEISEPEYSGSVIGIDLGLKDFIVTSKGERVKAPQYLRKAEKRLKRLQRVLSRRKRGSGGRERARVAFARQHEKVRNQRNDFLHKLTRRLVDENQVIYAESLAVKNMMRNHCLAKSIADAGWGEFIRQLSYKGEWYGCQINKIDRFFPSSKRCHHCGYINGLLKLSDRKWVCSGCGIIHDRDENAAINIELFGTAGAAETYASREDIRRSSENAASLKLEV